MSIFGAAVGPRWIHAQKSLIAQPSLRPERRKVPSGGPSGGERPPISPALHLKLGKTSLVATAGLSASRGGCRGARPDYRQWMRFQCTEERTADREDRSAASWLSRYTQSIEATLCLLYNGSMPEMTRLAPSLIFSSPPPRDHMPRPPSSGRACRADINAEGSE